MNHPYMYPDEAPWTDDYQELKEARRMYNNAHGYGYPRSFDDEEEFLDALYGVV